MSGSTGNALRPKVTVRTGNLLIELLDHQAAISVRDAVARMGSYLTVFRVARTPQPVQVPQGVSAIMQLEGPQPPPVHLGIPTAAGDQPAHVRMRLGRLTINAYHPDAVTALTDTFTRAEHLARRIFDITDAFDHYDDRQLIARIGPSHGR
jgi:hypothetical protein